MSILQKIKDKVDSLLQLGNMPNPRPEINVWNESNVKNMYIIGDLAGAPVIKLAMEQGYNVIQHIASLADAKSGNSEVYDLVIIGSGASGLNAALEAKEKGLSFMVLEKRKNGEHHREFPRKKMGLCRAGYPSSQR